MGQKGLFGAFGELEIHFGRPKKRSTKFSNNFLKPPHRENPRSAPDLDAGSGLRFFQTGIRESIQTLFADQQEAVRWTILYPPRGP